MKLIYEINGKKVPQNQLNSAFGEDELESALAGQIFEKAKQLANRTLRSLKCIEHGETPTVTIKYQGLNEVSFGVDSCCEPLTNRAKEKLVGA